jgi:hypothetical protein
MAEPDSTASCAKMKLVRPRFASASQPSYDSATGNVSWHDIIASESGVDFSHSMNAQIQFLKDYHPMLTQIRTIAAIFHISHRTYC